MQLISKFIIWLLVVIGLAVVAFSALVMMGDSGPTTQQLIDSSRELLKLEPAKPPINQQPEIPVITPSLTRPLASDSIPSRSESDSLLPNTPQLPLDGTAISPDAQKGIDEQKLRLNKINQIQADLHAIIRQKSEDIDMDALDDALARLQSMGNGDGIVAGVRIQDLRQNVRVAAEISTLSKEIGQYSTENELTDPKTMLDYVERLQNLQSMLIVPTVNNE